MSEAPVVVTRPWWVVYYRGAWAQVVLGLALVLQAVFVARHPPAWFPLLLGSFGLLYTAVALVSVFALRRHPEWVSHPVQGSFTPLPPLSRVTVRRYALGVGLGMLGCLAGLALSLAGSTRVVGVALFLLGLVVVIGFTVAIGRRPAR